MVSEEEHMRVLAYADDLAVFAESLEELQRSAKILYDLFLAHGLQTNLSKTKYMILGGGTADADAAAEETSDKAVKPRDRHRKRGRR